MMLPSIKIEFYVTQLAVIKLLIWRPLNRVMLLWLLLKFWITWIWVRAALQLLLKW